MSQETRMENTECLQRKTDPKKYPWFTVLIADGVKDKQDHIIYLGRGTTAVLPKEVPAIMANRDDCAFGKLEVIQYGHLLQARFVSCDPVAEAILNDLTPSVSGKLCKTNGAFIEVFELKAISFDFSKNLDPRVLSIREQRRAQEESDMTNVKCQVSEG